MSEQKYHLHGDLGLIPCKTKPVKPSKSKIHVLQDSGVTGNRHEVFVDDGEILRWTSDGREYVSCKSGFVLRHVGGDSEHGTQKVSAGIYEVRHEQEHNPWTNELRIVID